MKYPKFIYLTGLIAGLIVGPVAALITYDIMKYLKFGDSVTLLAITSAVVGGLIGIIVAHFMLRKMPQE